MVPRATWEPWRVQLRLPTLLSIFSSSRHPIDLSVPLISMDRFYSYGHVSTDTRVHRNFMHLSLSVGPSRWTRWFFTCVISRQMAVAGLQGWLWHVRWPKLKEIVSHHLGVDPETGAVGSGSVGVTGWVYKDRSGWCRSRWRHALWPSG